MNKKSLKLQTVAVLAMFAAISIVLVYLIHIPIFPSAPYLEYDPADIMIFICSLAISPLWSLVLTAVVSLVQGLLISGFNLGIIMHIAATGTAAFICGGIYRRRRTLVSAVIGLAAAALAATAVMVPMNIIFTPIYTGMARSIVVTLLPFPIIPFNLVKFGINAVITGLLFKPMMLILRKTGVTD
ncbi:MAG: ECF transporter S component [Clostridia bacterium]|nr:ECF transporter S component [Clostridia bacterium]